jgi:hypothetical protein
MYHSLANQPGFKGGVDAKTSIIPHPSLRNKGCETIRDQENAIAGDAKTPLTRTTRTGWVGGWNDVVRPRSSLALRKSRYFRGAKGDKPRYFRGAKGGFFRQPAFDHTLGGWGGTNL